MRDARLAVDGVQEAHRLDRAQRVARMELERHAVVSGIALHVEQVQLLLSPAAWPRAGTSGLPDGAEDPAEQHRHPLDRSAPARAAIASICVDAR